MLDDGSMLKSWFATGGWRWNLHSTRQIQKSRTMPALRRITAQKRMPALCSVLRESGEIASAAERRLDNPTVHAVYSVLTEMQDNRTCLSPVVQKFILHWGEMGTKWGINRTVAQIHALLFLSQRPLTAEEVAETLSVARSNVSTSLRELLGWRIVRSVSVFGDRRQHFESMKDLWEMFRVISEERKRREFDPTVEVVRECVTEAKKSAATDAYARERMEELLEFIITMSGLFDELRTISPATIKGMAKLRGGIRKLLQN
jgi:DNA-binding transcriptional regulator GbsR (MarR family)